MFNFAKQNTEDTGSVLFRGSMAPRLAEFPQFASAGVTITPGAGNEEVAWCARLEHPKLGEAKLICLKHFPPVPPEIIQFDPRLSHEDRQTILSGASAVSVRMVGKRGNVFADRKNLLRVLNLILGQDGLAAIDHLSQKFWTRDMLQEELAHDADLDIDSLYLAHMIYDGDDESDEKHVHWLHTHGLAEIGAVDFDILRPAPVLSSNGYDLVRATAFQLVENGAPAEPITIMTPGRPVVCVPVDLFNRTADPADVALRDSQDPQHNGKRVILCDTPRRSFFGLLGPAKTRPHQQLSNLSDDDDFMACFSDAATELMASRARHTLSVFKRLLQEIEPLPMQPMAKIGYPVDGGKPGEREHMWFHVHGIGDCSIDATLLNKPFNIAAMKEGDRTTHDLEKLTDWNIQTPFGAITPNEMKVARFIRQNKQEILRDMTKMKESGAES